MNSALQCLVNIRQFHEYYVKQRKHLKQVNPQNKMGHGGALVKSFADLMQEMWQSDTAVAPNGFKETLANISEQFAGYE